MTRDGIGFTRLWLATCFVGLVGGALLVATDHTAEGHFLWGVTTVIGGIPVTIGCGVPAGAMTPIQIVAS